MQTNNDAYRKTVWMLPDDVEGVETYERKDPVVRAIYGSCENKDEGESDAAE